MRDMTELAKPPEVARALTEMFGIKGPVSSISVKADVRGQATLNVELFVTAEQLARVQNLLSMGR